MCVWDLRNLRDSNSSGLWILWSAFGSGFVLLLLCRWFDIYGIQQATAHWKWMWNRERISEIDPQKQAMRSTIFKRENMIWTEWGKTKKVLFFLFLFFLFFSIFYLSDFALFNIFICKAINKKICYKFFFLFCAHIYWYR